jgi:SAM-dependent methyltransferase
MTTFVQDNVGESHDQKVLNEIAPSAIERSSVRLRGVIGSALGSMGNGAITTLAAGACAVVASQVALRAGVWMQPRPMPHHQAALLEHPLRLRYRNVGDLLGQLGVLAGMNVADLGCGTGLFTLEMAQRVGDSGHVHAVDIQPQMLAHARQRTAQAGIAKRVRFVHSGLHTLPMPDNSLDLALMVAVLGELPARVFALDEVRRVLKPGARLAISEEILDPAYTPAPLARRWAEQAGFRFGALTGNPFCYTLLLFAD